MGQTATRENSRAIGVAAALVLLLLGGFFYFPGHTYLHSDTQIYMPNPRPAGGPTLYGDDPVALRPHVSYTIYDEAALILRRATGLEFCRRSNSSNCYRFAGLAGAFLLGRACGLAAPWAVLFASFFGLGATIVGPAVLVAEYEPVPRGFAVPLLMLGYRLAAQERWLWAGMAVGWAILYHRNGAGANGGCDCDVVDAQARRRPVARGSADRPGHGRGIFAVELQGGHPSRSGSSRRSVRR